jgi:large conductance mechanosensitive channel
LTPLRQERAADVLLLTAGVERSLAMIKEFKEFIARGNVVDLAVAVILGAAFGKIVTTLVEGVLMPPIGLMAGQVDFSSLFLVLDRSKGVPASLAAAKEAGIPVIAYGAFINDAVNFLIVAFAVFLLVKQVNRFKQPVAVAATTRECPKCLSVIPIAARRCASCCADL